MIEEFWHELSEGEIHVRDHLQFELKSEFLIHPYLKRNIYKQEIFIFIPLPLNINSQTYSRQQFYLDQTNLIRYKTPSIALTDLVNPTYPLSPLNRLRDLIQHPESNLPQISDELKLFGVIFRATLRERIYELVKSLENSTFPQENYADSISQLCTEVIQVTDKFRQLKGLTGVPTSQDLFKLYFKYIDELMSTTIDEYFLILLKQIRDLAPPSYLPQDQQICQLIMKEQIHRKNNNLGPKTTPEHPSSHESFLHRQGLLNRFILEALTLTTQRFSPEEKYGNLLGALAAGIAMTVYMALFVWQSSLFVINSFPFVILAVLLYILKDRVKDGFKKLYYAQAYRWFPDYSTEIISPKGFKIGKLKENMAFIDSQQLPPGFLYIRNHQFHEELQALQRHETILQYKREVVLYDSAKVKSKEGRRRELTTIFRLNISRFVQKASNPFQLRLTLDPQTQEIKESQLPKVYHLNIIIQNTYLQEDRTPKSEIHTFRVIVDKVGIKRVEQIKNHAQ